MFSLAFCASWYFVMKDDERKNHCFMLNAPFLPNMETSSPNTSWRLTLMPLSCCGRGREGTETPVSPERVVGGEQTYDCVGWTGVSAGEQELLKTILGRIGRLKQVYLGALHYIKRAQCRAVYCKGLGIPRSPTLFQRSVRKARKCFVLNDAEHKDYEG